MDDIALQVFPWLIAIGMWAIVLIPQSSKLASWCRVTFKMLQRPFSRWRS